ncbi:MAG: outer membrane protein TolC [Flavobacteriaceae bacterium]|jgi:outer membrane protein TolC
MRKLVIVLGLFIPLLGSAQEDTSYLYLADLVEMAKMYHPILKQADLQNQLADAQLLQARGSFDPKLQSSYDAKQFKDKTYYDKFYNVLKVPLWFPLDPKIEVYRNEGEYLSPESYVGPTTDYWQVSTGVSLPIGKGLFIDERRAMVKQAKLYGNLAEAERVKIANKMLLNINKAYWAWFHAYTKYELVWQSKDIAEEIFRRVKLDYTFGEVAVIDTIQAKITFQTRQADFENATLDLQQARLGLSIHLWQKDDTPLELGENVIPSRENNIGVIPNDSTITDLVEWARTNHPEILKITTKQQQLDVEQRLNIENLKPELNLSYSLVDAPFSRDGVQSPEWQENYKIGMDFSIPILLRKERGKIQKTRVYQESMSFDLNQTRQEVITGVQSSYAELKTNERLTSQYLEISENYNRLFEAEVFNLENGESDLFKLNIQQDKYIDSMIKYLDVLVKFEKLKAELPYSVGLPYLDYQKMYD